MQICVYVHVVTTGRPLEFYYRNIIHFYFLRQGFLIDQELTKWAREWPMRVRDLPGSYSPSAGITVHATISGFFLWDPGA